MNRRAFFKVLLGGAAGAATGFIFKPKPPMRVIAMGDCHIGNPASAWSRENLIRALEEMKEKVERDNVPTALILPGDFIDPRPFV